MDINPHDQPAPVQMSPQRPIEMTTPIPPIRYRRGKFAHKRHRPVSPDPSSDEEEVKGKRINLDEEDFRSSKESLAWDHEMM
jgi:hypothetical protein